MTSAEATPKTDQSPRKSERTILTSNSHIRDHMADHCTMNPASSCRASRAVILSIGFHAPRPVIPENSIRADSRAAGESGHHPLRCLPCSICLSPRSPWQNPYVERLIGTLRHDCLDHILIF
jgi:hypothetical protein